MDIDPRHTVGMFGHDARQQRNFQAVENVGHPVDQDGMKSRIGEYDLVVALGGRVTIVGGLNIGGQHAADGRYLLQNRQGNVLTPFITLAAW